MSYIFKKTLSLSIVYSNCGREYKKILKEESFISLINNIEEYQKIHNPA